MIKRTIFMGLVLSLFCVSCKADLLLEDLKYVRNVLVQSFVKKEDRNLAAKLKVDVDGRYALIEKETSESKKEKQMEMIKSLVHAQKIADAKIEILIAAEVSDDYDIVRLKVFSLLYSLLKGNWKQVMAGKKRVKWFARGLTDNERITNMVKESLTEELDTDLADMIQVNVYDLWNNLFVRYKGFVDGETYVVDAEALHALLTDLGTQRNILEDLTFVEGWDAFWAYWLSLDADALQVQRVGENIPLHIKKGVYTLYRKNKEQQLKHSIKVFDVFIDRLLMLKNDMEDKQHAVSLLSSIDDKKKKNVFLSHIVLLHNKEHVFKSFLNKDFCKDYFLKYNKLIEKYVAQDDIKYWEDLCFENFLYDIKILLADLEQAKCAMGGLGLGYILWSNKHDTSLKNFVDGMIQVLNKMVHHVCVEKGYIDDSGLLEKIITSKIPVPEHIMKWMLNFASS